MGYKTTATTNRVYLILLHDLSRGQLAQCERLRTEAGRCWSDLVAAHGAHREHGVWLNDGDLRQLTKGGVYQLHSQSVQALGQKLLANVDTARELRQQQAAAGVPVEAQYPYKLKPYQTVTWKDQAIRRGRGTIILSNGRGQPDLVLPLPKLYHDLPIRKADLLWRADHYELALTVELDGTARVVTGNHVAGIDLGEINIAASVTQAGGGLDIIKVDVGQNTTMVEKRGAGCVNHSNFPSPDRGRVPATSAACL